MAVIYRQEFFAFCRAESFTRWRDYYCCLCKKVDHIGCDILRVFATIILPIRYAGKLLVIKDTSSVRYRENTGNATQIISVNIILYYIYTTLSQIKCLHQARRLLPTRTVCHAIQVSCYK